LNESNIFVVDNNIKDTLFFKYKFKPTEPYSNIYLKIENDYLKNLDTNYSIVLIYKNIKYYEEYSYYDGYSMSSITFNKAIDNIVVNRKKLSEIKNNEILKICIFVYNKNQKNEFGHFFDDDIKVKEYYIYIKMIE
jgi:hypothetical protein